MSKFICNFFVYLKFSCNSYTWHWSRWTLMFSESVEPNAHWGQELEHDVDQKIDSRNHTVADQSFTPNPTKMILTLNTFYTSSQGRSPTSFAIVGDLKGPKHLCTRVCQSFQECATKSHNSYKEWLEVHLVSVFSSSRKDSLVVGPVWWLQRFGLFLFYWDWHFSALYTLEKIHCNFDFDNEVSALIAF